MSKIKRAFDIYTSLFKGNRVNIESLSEYKRLFNDSVYKTYTIYFKK